MILDFFLINNKEGLYAYILSYIVSGACFRMLK